MPRTIEKLLYKFDELSDRSKEKARDWWRQCENQDSSFHEFVIDDAETIGEMLGIEFRTRSVRLMGGGVRHEPCIFWSGFSSQGNGACFEGTYLYEKGAAKKIREHAPQDTVLHAIADSLQDVQRRYFYRLRANVDHADHHYSHSRTTRIEVTNPETYADVPQDDEDMIANELRNFMDWIYQQLEKEYDYTMSDENVDESILLNEYEFYEDGSIV